MVIVRVNRSGNRSNDRAERSLRTIAPRPGPRIARSSEERAILPLSVADQQVPRTDVSCCFCLIVRVIVREVLCFIAPVYVSRCFCGAKVIVRFDRSDAPLEETNDHPHRRADRAWLFKG